MSHTKKLLEFMGEDHRFVKGEFYSYRQISDATGINISTLKNHLKFKYTFDDFLFRTAKVKVKNNYPVFDKKSEEVSAQWLKRRLV